MEKGFYLSYSLFIFVKKKCYACFVENNCYDVLVLEIKKITLQCNSEAKTLKIWTTFLNHVEHNVL